MSTYVYKCRKNSPSFNVMRFYTGTHRNPCIGRVRIRTFCYFALTYSYLRFIHFARPQAMNFDCNFVCNSSLVLQSHSQWSKCLCTPSSTKFIVLFLAEREREKEREKRAPFITLIHPFTHTLYVSFWINIRFGEFDVCFPLTSFFATHFLHIICVFHYWYFFFLHSFVLITRLRCFGTRYAYTLTDEEIMIVKYEIFCMRIKNWLAHTYKVNW